MNLEQIFYIVFSVLFVSIFLVYAAVCGERNIKWYFWLLFGLGYLGVDVLVYYNFENSFIYTFTSLICSFLILYYLTKRPGKSLLYAGMWLVIGLVGEILSGYILVFFYHIKLEDIKCDIKPFLLCSTFTRTLQFLFVIVFALLHKKKGYKQQTKYSIGFIIVLVGSMILLDSISSVMTKYANDNSVYYFIVFVVIMFIIDIVVYVLYVELEKNYHERVQAVKFQEYVEKQKMEYEQISIARHDMKNYILLLQNLLEEQNYQGLKKELNKKYERLNYEGTRVGSGDKYIDLILSNKISKAEDKGINVEVNIEILNTINMDNEELVTLLGNVMDNAIEACELCEEGRIEIDIKCNKGILTIEVKNSVSKDVVIVNNKLPASTKKQKGHGWGLRSVQKIVKQYGGIMEFSCKDKLFCAYIKIFV